MSLLELLFAVKEQHLQKDQLEQYRDQLASLYADMQIEIADLEKDEAIFFYQRTAPDRSDISIKREWKATDKGQRLILLNRYVKATAKVLDSLKSRLYSIY